MKYKNNDGIYNYVQIIQTSKMASKMTISLTKYPNNWHYFLRDKKKPLVFYIIQ